MGIESVGKTRKGVMQSIIYSGRPGPTAKSCLFSSPVAAPPKQPGMPFVSPLPMLSVLISAQRAFNTPRS